jgi:hypothetical protein
MILLASLVFFLSFYSFSIFINKIIDIATIWCYYGLLMFVKTMIFSAKIIQNNAYPFFKKKLVDGYVWVADQYDALEFD